MAAQPFQTARPLTPKEEEEILNALDAFCRLVDDADVDPDENDLDTPELADIVIGQWRLANPATRPSPQVLSAAVGAALGDYIKQALRFEWAVVTDEIGTSTALIHESPEPIVVAVFDGVLKRLETEDGDFVCDFLNGLWEDIGHLVR